MGACWSAERAWQWYEAQPWLLGCNFIPSSASNQLEMWQEGGFDPQAIDRELGWAAGLGLNCVRIFLHHLPWRADPEGFLSRVDRFLGLAQRRDMRVLLVLFDGVWDPFPKLGAQASPLPGVHNSRWVQCPGREILADPLRHREVEPYVRGVVRRFHADRRVLAWDLFNEPENPNPAYADVEMSAGAKGNAAAALLRATWDWVRDEQPAQPTTTAVWQGEWGRGAALSAINDLALTESDIVTFHSYAPADAVARLLDQLEGYERPIVCTEWMARPLGSTFAALLPLFAARHVGALHWGLVRGRTQTDRSWLSWIRPDEADAPWFHDVLQADGAPYDEEEVKLLRRFAGCDRRPVGAARIRE